MSKETRDGLKKISRRAAPKVHYGYGLPPRHEYIRSILLQRDPGYLKLSYREQCAKARELFEQGREFITAYATGHIKPRTAKGPMRRQYARWEEACEAYLNTLG